MRSNLSLMERARRFGYVMASFCNRLEPGTAGLVVKFQEPMAGKFSSSFFLSAIGAAHDISSQPR